MVETEPNDVPSVVPSSGSRTDNWKLLNREKNNKLERERKQRLTIALKELQSVLPQKYIVEIIQKLTIQHPTRNSRVKQYPNYLIAEAIVDYIAELQELENKMACYSVLPNNTGFQYPAVSDTNSMGIQTDLKLKSVFTETVPIDNTTAETQTDLKRMQTTYTQTAKTPQSKSIRESSKKSRDIKKVVAESPSKNSFNIHSLIGSDHFSNQIRSDSINIRLDSTQMQPKSDIKGNWEDGRSTLNKPNNWQPWSNPTPTIPNERNIPVVAEKSRPEPILVCSTTEQIKGTSRTSGTKRKSSHMIENVVGPMKPPTTPAQLQMVKTTPRSEPKGIAFPEPKLGVHKLKRDSKATIWNAANLGPKSKQSSSSRSISTQNSRTGTGYQNSDISRQGEARANIDHINFSINSIFGDMPMEDPFPLLPCSNQTKRQSVGYNQPVISNQPTMFDEEQARWTNDWACFGSYFHDVGQGQPSHAFGYPYAHGNQQFDHSIDFSYSKHPSSHNTTHNISQILQHNST